MVSLHNYCFLILIAVNSPPATIAKKYV